MEEYPEEWRTPPVSLISLVGGADYHALISTYLNSDQPPINTLALPDLAKFLLLLANKDSSTPPQPGIIKRDWLIKHRTRVPSVVAPLFTSDQVSGDPTQWLQVCSDLDNLKAVTRPRNIKLVVVIVQSSSKDDISEDRYIALRKRAEVDSKYVVTFNPNDTSELENSLKRLGSIFAELAISYYRDEGRKIKTRAEKKSSNSIELNIRYCFKVAVYAEFRRDWAEALKFYEDAYHTLRETIGTSTRLPPTQRLIEIKTIAELLHFKISTLLLHGGKFREAVIWFRQHNASYRRLVGAPEVMFLHWEWMSKQFLVFAELLETSAATVQNISSAASSADIPLTEWEFHPSYYYQLAANYLKAKRLSLELAISLLEDATELDSSAESVAPSIYIGHFARLLEQGNAVTMHPLTDEEYTRYAIAEGKRFQDTFEIIALLKKSCDSYSELKARRMGLFCGLQMAVEHFAVGDFNNAKQLFDGVASQYRQEGWVTLLWEVLGYLRECARKQGTMRDFMEYSLEMAALPVSSGTASLPFPIKDCGPAGPPNLSQREIIHKEVFALVSGDAWSASVEDNEAFDITKDDPLHLEIDLVSPLRLVLLASVAFHEQVIKPDTSTLITVSLLSQLPLVIEIDQLEVQFNQSQCNFVINNVQRPPVVRVSDDQQGQRVESAPSLSLVTNKWLRLTYDIKTGQSGKLECVSVIARMGAHFTICCRAESPASMDDLPFWKFEDRVETFPTKDPALAFSGQKATQVEEPDPLVELNLDASGPALVGESFMVPVTLVSKGHDIYSGELKVNLVDVRGGGLFSPRETETSSVDSHHVELLGVVGPEREDESQLGPDKIKQIQQSFGLVSVPFLKNGDTWSCKLEIKWHRAKPVMLFVSLSYSSNSNESATQKVNVHKSLQIEGQTAVVLSHHFMLPFRRDPLLLSRIKQAPDSELLVSLPLNEKSLLIVSAKNCTEVPLQLQSLSIDPENSGRESSCVVQHGDEDLLGHALLMPGQEFKKVFTVTPALDSPKLQLGTLCLRWRRNAGSDDKSTEAWVLTKHNLPDVEVELSTLVVSMDCPPYAILGEPFTYLVNVQNQTQLLQEVKFSLADAQSFVLSGSHNDSVFILPKSEHMLSYKLVPLASGLQQLPKVTVTSVRYSAGFHPSTAASGVFVFPSKPDFKIAYADNRRTESIVQE